MARITKTILCSVTSTNKDLPDLEQVQVKLRDAFAGKMFLLVLDDVWNDNPNTWDLLRSPFTAGAKGSKIIITTCNKYVASMMCAVLVYEPGPLPLDYCWLLFSRHAFEYQNIDEL